MQFHRVYAFPGTDDYKAIEPHIWVENPHDLHDCIHPLTPTKLPLREFCALYARQVTEAEAKNPMRIENRRIPFKELVRVSLGTFHYSRAFKNLYHDYPRHLWE